MAPNTQKEDIDLEPEEFEKLVAPQAAPRKYDIIYKSVIIVIYIHIAAIYGLYLCFTDAFWVTIIFEFILLLTSIIGTTAGPHRLWSHKAYKAKLPLEILLMVMSSVAGQGTVFYWVRGHRIHHKYSDTDADPHNATRGFFFSHIGWLLVRIHPKVKKQVKFTDVSDINNNPILRFQKKYAAPFILTVCFVIPTAIPMYFWMESFNNSWHLVLLRYVLNLHCILFINSAAHMWGNKPYDISLQPTQNIGVSLIACGEGFHNYHHAFPWDYRAAELGNNTLNLTTKFIDFFAWIGWAYDLKTAPEDLTKKRAQRTGDGTNLWGWGNKTVMQN